jgi:hypothetical protein
MSDDELIAKAVGALRRQEARRSDGDDMQSVTVDSLPRRRIDGTTIHFDSDTTHAHIEVVMERESGEIVSATYPLPPP